MEPSNIEVIIALVMFAAVGALLVCLLASPGSDSKRPRPQRVTLAAYAPNTIQPKHIKAGAPRHVRNKY